jgi:hypothetical protein
LSAARTWADVIAPLNFRTEESLAVTIHGGVTTPDGWGLAMARDRSAYVNFMMDEGQERVVNAYRDNYPRLAAMKEQYDPTNPFGINQHIRPSAHSAGPTERAARQR